MNVIATTDQTQEKHPLGDYLRVDRLPHIWCPGCGLGTVLAAFIRGLIESGLEADKVAVVSGIGCTGRVAGYTYLDSFHTTHGRAVAFATGLKLANPALKVVVFSGDGDIAAIGGNHLIHAGRRNIDMTILCVNNFTYGMTGGQFGPTTPETARSTTSRAGNIENPEVHLEFAIGIDSYRPFTGDVLSVYGYPQGKVIGQNGGAQGKKR